MKHQHSVADSTTPPADPVDTPPPAALSACLDALKTGDAAALEAFLHRCEPLVRRLVRMRLTDPRLRRQFDSLDIWQSVLVQFLDHVQQEQLELSSPEHLQNLLVRMALHNLIDKARRPTNQALDLPEDCEPAAPDPSPSQALMQQDLLQACRTRLSAREWDVVQRVAEGQTFVAIGQELGEDAAAVRMRYHRAVARVQRELRKET